MPRNADDPPRMRTERLRQQGQPTEVPGRKTGGSQGKMGKKTKEGRCHWCSNEGVLRLSHLIPDFWGKEGRKWEKHLLLVDTKGPRLAQQGYREHLLCTRCETEFSVVERQVSINWRNMQGKQEILGTNGRWRQPTQWDLENERKREKRGQRRRPRRWTGVDGKAWITLAAINAWRTSVSSYGDKLRKEEGWLRWLVKTELGQEARTGVPLLFYWATGRRVGVQPGHPAMRAVEHLAHPTGEGNITMQHGGFSLVLGVKRQNPPRGIERHMDIQGDGTWVILEGDWSQGLRLERMKEALKKLEPLERKLKRKRAGD